MKSELNEVESTSTSLEFKIRNLLIPYQFDCNSRFANKLVPFQLDWNSRFMNLLIPYLHRWLRHIPEYCVFYGVFENSSTLLMITTFSSRSLASATRIWIIIGRFILPSVERYIYCSVHTHTHTHAKRACTHARIHTHTHTPSSCIYLTI